MGQLVSKPLTPLDVMMDTTKELALAPTWVDSPIDTTQLKYADN